MVGVRVGEGETLPNTLVTKKMKENKRKHLISVKKKI